MSDKTYIAVQSGGYWGDACQRAGLLKSGESCVIEYKQFMTFMNTRQVSQPMFVSNKYGVCVEVARELNESASEVELQRTLREWVNARESL